MNCHGPWDGCEHLFALPASLGPVRVVLVLADEGSYHDYPDLGAYESGVTWLDILDEKTMFEADELLEKLVDFETELLGNQSRRVVLFGKSQGGGMCLLRLLRSRRRLGGFIGGMCHVPTMPHLPWHADPLALASGRTLANATVPVRILCGDADTIFASSMVRRGAARLRSVGGFTDVKVEVMAGLTHEDALDSQGCWVDADAPAPELAFLRKHLPEVLRGSGAVSRQRPTKRKRAT